MSELSADSEYERIREEVRSEHALISNRLTWYVTSQSFLVTAFAISRGNAFSWHPWFSTVLLPLLGLGASSLILPSIAGGCRTLELWHEKQQQFLARHLEYKKALGLQRARWIERRGMLFPQCMPLLFGCFWVVILIGSARLR